MKSEDQFKAIGEQQLGKPYEFGYKPSEHDNNPQKFDCSGLVHWLYAQVGCKVPEGSQNQFEGSDPISDPKLGDVGFFRHPGAPTHHVGMLWTDGQVLEARGEPFNKVIFRPQEKWEAWKEFTGWRRFRNV